MLNCPSWTVEHVCRAYCGQLKERRRLCCEPSHPGSPNPFGALLVNELTERLTVDQPVVMGGANPTAEELRNRVGEMGYVLVKFTGTRGGTELGFPLDRDVTDLSGADFENGTGTVH